MTLETDTPEVDEEEAQQPAPASVLADFVESDDEDGALAYAAGLHPAVLADVMSSLDFEGRLRELIMERLAPRRIGEALAFLEAHYREDLLTELPPERIAAIVRRVEDDVATDIVQELPDDLGEQVLRAVPQPQQAAIGVLMEHEEDTAGGRMTGQRIAVRPERRASEVIEDLRSLRPDAAQPFYVYVTDEGGVLEGVLNLRSLLTAQPDTPVLNLATTDVVAVTAGTDQEEAARLLKRYKLLSLPVVDDEHRLVGTITHDDLLDVLEEEATEDMFRQVGVHEDEDLRGVFRSVRFRLPWLLVNLITVLGAAFVVSLYEGTVARVAVLAAFLPVVAGQGGNAGIQTLTVVIRSLALGRLAGRNLMHVIAHEVGTGLITGGIVGVTVGLIALAWQGNATLGVIVGVALVANMLVGVVAGVLIPMSLQRLRQDPALSAGIWLTTATDILGLLVFLSLAAAAVEALD